MKKYLSILMMLVCTSFVSCGGSDDENQGEASNKAVTVENMTGLWELCHIKGWSVNGDNQRYSFDGDVNTSRLDWLEEQDVMEYVRYEFTAQGLFTCYKYYNGDFRQGYQTTFALNGNSLIFDPSGRHEEQVTISYLTDTELVIYDRNQEEMYELTAIFRRIK